MTPAESLALSTLSDREPRLAEAFLAATASRNPSLNLPEAPAAILDAWGYAERRAELCRRAKNELRDKVPLDLVEIPYFFTGQFGFKEVEQVAQLIEDHEKGRGRRA
jgi:hypothetical protein